MAGVSHYSHTSESLPCRTELQQVHAQQCEATQECAALQAQLSERVDVEASLRQSLQEAQFAQLAVAAVARKQQSQACKWLQAGWAGADRAMAQTQAAVDARLATLVRLACARSCLQELHALRTGM